MSRTIKTVPDVYRTSSNNQNGRMRILFKKNSNQAKMNSWIMNKKEMRGPRDQCVTTLPLFVKSIRSPVLSTCYERSSRKEGALSNSRHFGETNQCLE